MLKIITYFLRQVYLMILTLFKLYTTFPNGGNVIAYFKLNRTRFLGHAVHEYKADITSHMPGVHTTSLTQLDCLLKITIQFLSQVHLVMLFPACLPISREAILVFPYCISFIYCFVRVDTS